MSSDRQVTVQPTPAVSHFSQATVTWFPAEAEQLSAIRAHLRRTLTDWCLAATLSGPVEVLTTELCTNVIRHTISTRLAVRLECTVDGTLHVAVKESHPGPPPRHALELTEAQPDDTHGRGLHILDALAAEWGVYRSDGTTTTWFVLHPDDTPVTVPQPGVAAAAAPEQSSTELIASLHAAVHRSQLLLRITEALSSAHDQQEIADAITRTVRGPLGAAFAGIAVTLDDRTMRYVSLEPLPRRTADEWARFDLDLAAPVSAAARTGTAYFHADRSSADAMFPGIAEHMEAAQVSAMAHLPLTARGVTFGTLSVSWGHERELDADTRALLLIIAGYAAHALARQ